VKKYLYAGIPGEIIALKKSQNIAILNEEAELSVSMDDFTLDLNAILKSTKNRIIGAGKRMILSI
jgi:hypothetical protein